VSLEFVIVPISLEFESRYGCVRVNREAVVRPMTTWLAMQNNWTLCVERGPLWLWPTMQAMP
jgi:hypothetical protein